MAGKYVSVAPVARNVFDKVVPVIYTFVLLCFLRIEFDPDDTILILAGKTSGNTNDPL